MYPNLTIKNLENRNVIASVTRLIQRSTMKTIAAVQIFFSLVPNLIYFYMYLSFPSFSYELLVEDARLCAALEQKYRLQEILEQNQQNRELRVH